MDAFTQLERMANRVLDWSDFRIYRVREAAPRLVYRGALGWPDRGDPPFDSAAAAGPGGASGEKPLVIDDARATTGSWPPRPTP